MTQSRLQQVFPFLTVNRYTALLVQERHSWQDKFLLEQQIDTFGKFLPLKVIVIFFVKLVHQFLIDSRPYVSLPHLGLIEH